MGITPRPDGDRRARSPWQVPAVSVLLAAVAFLLGSPITALVLLVLGGVFLARELRARPHDDDDSRK